MRNPGATPAETVAGTCALAGRRVLVVDDELDVIDAAREVLAGAAVESALTSEDARTKLAGGGYDVAVIDLMGVDGFELLGEFGDRLPCVVFTGHAHSPESLRTSIERHAALYLPKSELAILDRHLARLLDDLTRAGADWRAARDRGWASITERLDFLGWFRGSAAERPDFWAEVPAFQFLRSITWLGGVPEPDLRALARLAERHGFGPGTRLFNGSGAREPGSFFIVRSGEVEVIRDGAGLGLRVEGDAIGEDGAVLHAPDPAEYRARGEVQLLGFPAAGLSTLLDRSPALARALAALVSRRAGDLEASLRRQLRLLEERSGLLEERERLIQKLRESAVYLFLVVGGLMALSGAAMAVPRSDYGWVQGVSWAVQVFGLLLVVIFALYTGRGARFFGLTLAGAVASLRRGLFVAAGFVPIAIGLRLACDRAGIVPAGTPLFALEMSNVFLIYVLLVVPLQEVIYRGVLQTYVRELTGGGRRGSIAAVGFAALMYAFGHLFYSPLFALVTLLPGIAWGVQFEKDRTVAGVTLSHALLGWFTLSCLSLDRVLGG